MPESPIANDALATSRLQPGCSRRQAIENVHFRAGNLIRRRRNDDMNDVMRRGYVTKAFSRTRDRMCLTMQATYFKRLVAGPAGLEPATSWFVARRSIQLSYGPVSRSELRILALMQPLAEEPLVAQQRGQPLPQLARVAGIVRIDACRGGAAVRQPRKHNRRKR